MCGIAGLIHRGKNSDVGSELTSMLQALRHRGPDSTGFALYGNPTESEFVIRFKLAEQEALRTGFKIHDEVKERQAEVDRRMEEMCARVTEKDIATEYARRYRFTFDGDMKRVADYIEDVEDVEILSIGQGLELIKDRGDANTVSEHYDLGGFEGTHQSVFNTHRHKYHCGQRGGNFIKKSTQNKIKLNCKQNLGSLYTMCLFLIVETFF